MSSTLVSRSASQSHDDADSSRSNLLLLTRLVIRGLLESVMKTRCRTLSADHSELKDMFTMLEKVLKHGFKSPRNVLYFRSIDDQLWSLIERLGKADSGATEAVQCIQQLPTVSSSLCRIRAWLRLAVMQKKLADYFQMLVEASELVDEFYEPDALLRHDSTSVVFCGSLIGLRVFDCNLYMKEADLSKLPAEVDLSIYIKIPTIPLDPEEDARSNSESEISTHTDSLVEQKHYLEERNKFLQTRLENLQQQLAILCGMKDRVVVNNNESGQDFEVLSISSLEESRSQLVKLQDMETAMSSMEKDIHEKQDNLVTLRSQLDDVKKINIELYQKLRVVEESNKHREKLNKRLELECVEAQKVVSDFELKLQENDLKLTKQDEFLNTLQLELRKKTEFCASIQSELADVKNNLDSLEENLHGEKFTKEELILKVQMLQGVEQNYKLLQNRYRQVEDQMHDYEKALEEMGVQMKHSRLKFDDLKESAISLVDAQWEEDAEVINCKSCEKEFSLARRRHHCRNCGGIFCGSCSENTMPLPSSAKPVRVCDACYELLLKRYSVKTG